MDRYRAFMEGFTDYRGREGVGRGSRGPPPDERQSNRLDRWLPNHFKQTKSCAVIGPLFQDSSLKIH
jgi:hypothetical protein